MLTDSLSMIATIARRRKSPAYVIVQPTQHWKISNGTFYRECVVRLADGTLRLYAVRDDLVPVAA